MSLNEKLKKARQHANFTQGEVECKTGINKKTISNWENGVSRPDVDNISTLCNLYNVSPNYILEWNDEDINSVHTIAAHHEGDEWTDEELQEVEDFKKYIISKRKKLEKN